MHSNTGPKEPIAVVGSACRFAGGVDSPSKLWELLQKPRDVRTQIPADRFNVDGFYHPKHSQHGHSNIRHSYMLEQDPTVFDAEFFGINPLEAKAMDPQQRLLLETVYEAVESAGMTIEGLRGSDTGVYAGLMCGDYEAVLLRDLDVAPTYWAVGTSRAVLSNRVSYFFDWHGASVTVDTACSSSLVAVHHAIQALRAGDSHMAVACGANLILGPEMYIIESKVKMLSPDGLGRMWDKDANGYARGEGVGAVILKTLSQALADNDHIECIIRETGLNQDGATTGLTMPNAAAQRALIHNTYQKAGLDLSKPSDRPQFFEAHGTGTPAGDPVEAEAICRAFFSGDGDKVSAATDDTLYVGSIKTVLGHTEGTAGIAALLKASLALQNSTLPPNLLFNSINPDVLPFYDHLEILKSPKPWPQMGAETQPQRASVNSFGFGGTNAHAILESYAKPPSTSDGPAKDAVFTPFVFSAASEDSLRSTLSAFATYLQNSQTSTKDLAYTLRERRTVFPYRASFSAKTTAGLQEAISSLLQDTSSNIGTRKLGKAAGVRSRILGIFTGQGAQYALMGAELIQQSSYARQIIKSLDKYLAALPDAPTWSLEGEILASPENSRVSQAAISQPLCTAIQILVVAVLHSAGVGFDAVVGHSSGEIAAAYAAGFLTARDAICVAYYRGLHCRHACSPNGEDVRGAMMAVGTTMEDAIDICQTEEIEGRVGLAAVNSSSSVTLSGDEDAIEELRAVLSDENKFNRRLKVDQAYHSKHMLPCSEPYIESLRHAGVKAQKPASSSSKPTCTWFSSVYDGEVVEWSSSLNDTYWTDNMTRPVLFAQALAAASTALAAENQGIDAVVEIGPHAALRGPASQTLEETLGKAIPYTGTLVRGQDSVASLAASMGFLWCNLDKTSIDLGSCERTLSGQSNFTVLKGLPSYQWNHQSRHWFESRRSRRLRQRDRQFHPLLGNPTPESSAHVMRWKNVLKPSEIPWVEGHQVQRQIVFPAAGYVTTAIEAARSFASEDTSIKLVELSDFRIHQAVMFDESDSGIEVLIELSDVSRVATTVTANFTYSAAMGGDAAADLVLAAQGKLKVILGKETSVALLPERPPRPPHMIPVEASRLYNFMEGLEYDFSGPFRSLIQLRRKLGYASCVAKKESADDAAFLLVHPADLDAAFQSVMLAYSYPGDDQLRLLHLPTSISTVRVNPAAILDPVSNNGFTQVDASCSREDRLKPGSGFSGNVSMYYSEALPNAAVQVEHVKFKPVGTTASDDRNVFYKMHFVPSKPDGDLAAEGIQVTQSDEDLLWILSRIAAYFLRQFDDSVPEDAPVRTESPLCHYLHYARHMTDLIRKDEHRWAKKEWLNDTLDDVMNEIEEKGVSGNSDVRIMLLVGQTMPRVFTGETTMLEHFRESGLLDEYYAHGFGTMQSSIWLGNAVKQITDCHPHLSLLEVGAGTGGATKNILRSIGYDFDKYTFTDISSSFFENAAEALAPWGDRMVFSVFNAEMDPTQQGFKEGAYDVVVAYMVIHATARLDEALRNLRKLLKPGGYLIIGEGASDGPLQAGAGFIFGTLPGWWRGVEEGRTLSPLVSTDEWDKLLKRTGYAGIDTMSPPRLLETFGISLFVAQAIDERIETIRQPLVLRQQHPMKRLIILGGQTSLIANIAEELHGLLLPLADETSRYKSLEDMPASINVDHETTILSLLDLESPVFRDMTAERWHRFKSLFTESTILWMTTGRLADEPYCNMTVGFGRSAVHEEEDLRLQFVDVPDPSKIAARYVAASLVRFVIAARQLGGQTDILYTMEPEVVVDDKGHELVPRLKAIAAANARLNSAQRPITRAVSMTKSVVELQRDGGKAYMVRDLSRYELEHRKRDSVGDTIELTTTHAILSAIRTRFGHFFLILAADSNGTRYLSLVAALTSVIVCPKAATINCESLLGSASVTEETLLALVASQLVAVAVVGPLVSGEKLLLHNAPTIIAQASTAQSSTKGVALTLATDRDIAGSTDIVKLSPYLGRAELRHALDVDQFTCFVGFSEEGSSETEINILSALSPYCRKEGIQTLYSANGGSSHLALTSAVPLGQELRAAISNIWGQVAGDINVITLESLCQGELPSQGTLTVVKDWACPSPVPARITRFDTKPLFKADKTYWLCGLSGALGISLCDWMVERGIRYLVLTSRNPKIDPAWIENHARKGVVIKILSCDVTDEAALRRVHQSIVKTMPPIVGALNAAMVLRDVSIRNMDFDQVQDVVRPKVLGSVHLDRIFYDVDLDFFVLISSINCVIGNVGQANYAAANMGMCGVAANRRKRGLRSSVANVGAIIGVGYITQSDRQLDATVAKTAMMHLSEEDFHQIFAEAMEAGYLDSDMGPEISTGLLDIVPDDLDDDNIPKWYSDPKFSRFILHKTTNKDDGKKDQGGGASIHERLQTCKSQPEVLEVVQEAFGAQLRKILQTSLPDEELMMMRSVDLGLDSLISVDIRSWFAKNLRVSIPVLKIMASDAQMSSLTELAAESLPTDLIPLVAGAELTDSAASAPASTDDTTSTPRTTSTSPSSPADDVSPWSSRIDWNAETCPPQFSREVASASNPPRGPPRVILLTGCSGLLGHHLLDSLLAQPGIDKVICVAVRRLTFRLQAKELPAPSDRVVYYEGDLTHPLLGLTESVAANIFQEVDAVVHNGSDTSHLKYYSALRDANVGSTKRLLQLCHPRNIPLHYVSSAGVALFSGLEAFPEISCTTTGSKPPADGSHGYMCGKWVCESMLERVHSEHPDWELVIQRPSTIIREGDDTAVAKAEFDWVNALLHYSHKIRAVPRVVHNEGTFDLVYVRTVCDDVIRELLAPAKKGSGEIRYVHNVGDIVIPMGSMNEIGKHNGYDGLYEVLSMGEWTAQAIDAGLHPAVAALIETFDEPGVAKYPRLLREKGSDRTSTPTVSG